MKNHDDDDIPDYEQHLINLHEKGDKKELLRLFIRDMCIVAGLLVLVAILFVFK